MHREAASPGTARWQPRYPTRSYPPGRFLHLRIHLWRSRMAIQKIVGSQPGAIVVIDGATVHVVRPAVFEAPKAAAYLGALPDELRLEAVEDLLEHGAATASLAQTSAHVVMLESKIGELTNQLSVNLAKQLQEAGADSSKITLKLLQDHAQQLTTLLAPLTDVNAKDGLPTKMADLLELSNRHAIKQIEAMLNEGDDGVIGKAVKRITDQIKETGIELTRAMAADMALRKGSVRRGGDFEDVIGARLPILARPIGRVEHCSRTPGDKACNTGDYVIVLDGFEPDLRIAVEAKSQKTPWSAVRIRQELKAARMNRNSVAAIMVSDSADMLPGKVGFGQVGPFDFFVVFDSEVGDDTALACALYMAKVAALSTTSIEAGVQVDTVAAQREVSILLGLLDSFSKIESSSARIDREVDHVRAVAGGLREDLLAALRRLDSILTK